MTPESNQKRPKRPWSRGDKLLIIVPTALAALALGLFFWNRAANTLPAALPPPHPMPAVNARDYFLKAAVLAKQSGSVGPNSQAVQLLHQGFQYPYQEPPPTVFKLPIKELRAMNVLARHLAKQAQADAGQGQWEASADAGMDTLQMGVAAAHGADDTGTLLSSYSQYAGEKALWKVVGHLNAAQARMGTRRLEAIHANRVPYVKMLREQKASIQRGLSQEMDQPNWRDDWITTTPPVLTYPKAWRNHVLSTTRLRLTSKQQILTANAKYMDALIAAAQQPYAAHLAYPSPPGDPVNQLSGVSHYGYLWIDIVNLDTQNALLLTSFALRAYRLDHGTYPAALTALVPGYLKAVPTDPFALSGPLRYKTVDAKYVLYSVGPDGKDDGGKAIFDTSKPPLGPADGSDQRRYVQQDSKGDVVAGVNIF